MPTGRAITIAAIAGSILLLPVIVILGLGLYGTSITGDFPVAEEAGPALRVEPAVGSPGTPITVRGKEWVPRTLVRIELIVRSKRPEISATGEVVEVSTSVPSVFVGEVVVSRAGAFAVETQLPTTLPLSGSMDVQFVASARYRGGEPAGRSRAAFQIEPGPGQLNILVQTEPDVTPAAGALVELRDRQGQLVAAVRTGPSGLVEFSGLSLDVDYEARARVVGFGVTDSIVVQAGETTPTHLTFRLARARQGRVYVGGVPAEGAANSRAIAVIDLAALTPVLQSGTEPISSAWAMTADAVRGRLFVASEVATEVRVVDAASGQALEPIPLAFSLVTRVIDVDSGRTLPGAVVQLFWNVRGQRVLVRAGETDADGQVLFDGLIAGSSYDLQALADGYLQPDAERTSVTIVANRTTTAEVGLVHAQPDARNLSQRVNPALSPDSWQAPATGLVVSDLAIDPVSGRLYVTGSDLENGHLFVIDPDRRTIVHDWHVPPGVGDVAPHGDGRTVLLANRPFSTVTRIDVETGEIIASAVVPAWPEAIAVDRAGAIYVASLREGRVSRLDAGSLSVTASRELEEGVNRLAILPDGSALLVSNIWTDTVTALDPQDLTIQFLLPVAKSPRALALDPLGAALIVGSAERGTVAVYDTDTYTLRQRLALEIPINDIVAVSVGA